MLRLASSFNCAKNFPSLGLFNMAGGFDCYKGKAMLLEYDFLLCVNCQFPSNRKLLYLFFVKNNYY